MLNSRSNMSSSDQSIHRTIYTTNTIPYLPSSAISQPSQTGSALTIADLLEHNKALRSQITLLEGHICEKYAELLALQDDPMVVIPTGAEQPQRPIEPANRRKLEGVMEIMNDLEDFTYEDGLNEDVIDEYIRHVEHTYGQLVLIIGPDAVWHLMRDASPQRLRQLLDAKHATDYEKVMFALKQDGRYSLVLYNKPNASFYHYDTGEKKCELAQRLMLSLREFFEVEQLVEVKDKSSYTDSALFTVDNMMKVILNAEEESRVSVSPVQLLHMPSQPDHLKIIIMSRYIVSKLAQIEGLIAEDSGMT